MHVYTIPRVVAAIAVIVAGGLVLLAGGPSDEPPAVDVPGAGSPRADGAAAEPRAGVEPAALQHDALAAAKERELEAMSETFRNTTFLIAIRDSGYVCNELLRVYGGVNDSRAWTATCSEMLAYTVRVASAGALHVEPMLEHVDGVPWPAPRRELPSELPRQMPPPR